MWNGQNRKKLVIITNKFLFLRMHIGFLVSVVWILPAMTATYLFANRSLKLLAIDAGLYVVLFTLAGGIMGIW